MTNPIVITLTQLIADNIGLAIFISAVLLLALGYYFSSFKRLLKDVKHLLERFPKLELKVEKLSNVIELFVGFKIATSESPSTLNEVGQGIADSVNANQIVENHLDDLKREHGDYKNFNPYKIQTVCMDFATSSLKDKLDENELDRLERVAFDKGSALEIVLMVLGYVFRDKLLDEMGIPISHVDTHDPNAK